MAEARGPGLPGLYDPRNEHDSCGVGFVANIKGRKSHDIIRRGLQILVNLDHRGAVGADPLMGDGAGCMIQTPDALLRHWAEERGIELPPPGRYAVAMCFLPMDEKARAFAVAHMERFIRVEGQELLAWREVPVDTAGLGAAVIETMPYIAQAIVAAGPDIADQDEFERKILTIRKQTLNRVSILAEQRGLPGLRDFYIPSFSTRTVVYKGLLLAPQVESFYEDLRNPLTVSALALVHQRFSTNTFPSWRLAHPYRFICHNGEINTVRGNVNWMHARRQAMSSDLLGADLDKMVPLIGPGQSDTACIDNALELLVIGGGYSLAHAMMMLIPEAWADPLMDPERRAFYEYHAALMEPWDGPAAIAFTDGRQIGATLDRNGLRPARYIITDDDHVIMASEAGVLPVPEEKIVRKWRLQPGKMLLIDLEEGRIIDDDEIKQKLAAEHPYEAWLKATQYKLEDLPDPAENTTPPRANDPSTRLAQQQAFGYTQEDIQFFLEPMAREGDDPVGSMGTDTPIAVLSNQPKLLYNYFKQNFAQVTNPPIDPIREEAGDVAGLDDRAAAQPARPRGRDPSPARSGAADPDRRRPRQDPQHRAPDRRPLQDRHARHHLAGGGRRGRDRAGARPPLPRGDRGGRGRAQHPDPVRPRGVGRAGADPGAAGDRGRAPSPDPRGACAPRPASWSRPAKRARCIISACWPAMAPRRSTPISPSRPRSTRSAPRPVPLDDYESSEELHQGDRQGHPQGDVQDGHLDLPVLLRRADLRRGRPRKRDFVDKVFHRHRDDDRRRRTCLSIARGTCAATPRPLATTQVYQDRARRRRRLCVPPARRGPRLDRRRPSPGCSTRCAAICPADYQAFAATINDQSERLLTIRGLMKFKPAAASRCRSTRSSRRRTSSSVSPPAR